MLLNSLNTWKYKITLLYLPFMSEYSVSGVSRHGSFSEKTPSLRQALKATPI
jgi:hypothetical protein